MRVDFPQEEGPLSGLLQPVQEKENTDWPIKFMDGVQVTKQICYTLTSSRLLPTPALHGITSGVDVTVQLLCSSSDAHVCSETSSKQLLSHLCQQRVNQSSQYNLTIPAVDNEYFVLSLQKKKSIKRLLFYVGWILYKKNDNPSGLVTLLSGS